MPGDDVLSFPCDIPIKIFGRNADTFRDAALAIVRDHYDGVGDERVHERESGAGNYLSLTVVVRAESREQIDAVYRELSAHAEIMMVL